MNPILGDLKGYWSGSSTCIFHTPPVNGANPDKTQQKGWVNAVVLGNISRTLTFCWTIEPHIELLHAIVDKADLIVGHEPADEGQRR